MEASIEQKMTRIKNVKKFLETKKVSAAMILLTKKIVSDYDYVKALCKKNAIYKGDDNLWHWNNQYKINEKSVKVVSDLLAQFRKDKYSKKNKSKSKKQKITEASPDSSIPNDEGSILKDIQTTINKHISNDHHIETLLSRIWIVISTMQQDIKIMANPQLEEVNENTES